MIICRKTKQQTAKTVEIEIERFNKSFILENPVTRVKRGRITTDKNAPESDE